MSIHEISKAVDRFAPLRKAETSWDNVGILVNTGTMDNKVLLTIDLTRPVLEECIAAGIKNVLSYHPVIFKPIKKLGSKEHLIVDCIKNGINVFSPHSALDPMMNEYIYRMFNEGVFYRKRNHGSNVSSIRNVVDVLKKESGMEKFRVCLARDHTMESVPELMYVGVGATFKHVSLRNCVVITGEMSHHDLLHCVANEASVVLMEHSNSERICLRHISERLEKELPEYRIFVSKSDKDPVTII